MYIPPWGLKPFLQVGHDHALKATRQRCVLGPGVHFKSLPTFLLLYGLSPEG